MKGIVVEPLACCLKLEEDKYYVGMTYNFNLRYAQHECGEGSRWTRKYKPVEVVEIIPNSGGEVENLKTKKYMEKYGWHNVRGGYWCKMEYKMMMMMMMAILLSLQEIAIAHTLLAHTLL
eukprot:SAG11_NODE_562_length_8523_cov_38.875356_2_plen_120_part_00